MVMNYVLEMLLSSEHFFEQTVFKNQAEITRRITNKPQTQVS